MASIQWIAIDPITHRIEHRGACMEEHFDKIPIPDGLIVIQAFGDRGKYWYDGEIHDTPKGE